MSVSKYIEEYNQRRDDRIQKNLADIAKDPYPIEELNALDPESPIAKLYGPDGEIKGAPSELRPAAISQDKDLFNRLKKGSRNFRKIKQNEELQSVDPEKALNDRYEAVIKGTASTGLDFNEFINDSEEFEFTYDAILEDKDLSGLDASGETVRLAFIEMYGDDGSEGAINDNDDIESDTENDAVNDAVNDDAGEVDEDIEIDEDSSKIVSNEPALEKEVIQQDPITIESGEQSKEDQLLKDELDSSTASQSTINQNTEGDTNISNEISKEPLTNEQYIDAINGAPDLVMEEKFLEGDVEGGIQAGLESMQAATEDSVSTDPEVTDEASINIEGDTTKVDSKKSSSSFDDFFNEGSKSSSSSFASFFGDDVDSSVINSHFGVTESAEENSAINSSENNESNVANNDNTSVTNNAASLSEKVTSLDVSKEPIAIDKNVAPINKSEVSNKSESVKVTEIKSDNKESGDQIASENKSKKESVSSGKEEKSEERSDSGGLVNIDTSEMTNRLRKIENLLSGPLEVKIVE